MKKLLLPFLLLPLFLFAQTNCKLQTLKDPLTGLVFNGLSVNMDHGKCLISKRDSTIVFTYKTSFGQFIFNSTIIDVEVKIDSAEITFDHSIVVKCIANGHGFSPNSTVVLKPKINNPVFTIRLSASLLKLFLSSSSVGCKLFGERGTEGFIGFAKWEMKKINNSIACVN